MGRSSEQIFSKEGGIFWGIVMLLIGAMAILQGLGVPIVNFYIVVGVLALVAGLWLLAVKLIPGR